jgi:hypothetical protein
MATTTARQSTRRRKYGTRAAVAAALMLEQAMPGIAAGIDNTATSTGTYNSGTINSNTSSANVLVTAASAKLEITAKAVSAGPTINGPGGQATLTDVGDTITYQYTIKNTGNVTLTGVTPVDTGPTFNGVAGTGSWAAAFSPAPVTLNPNATQTFFRTWTLSNLDAYRAATVPTTGASLVSNTATGTSLFGATTINTTAPNASKTVTTKIDGVGKLLLAKSKVLNDTLIVNGTGDLNETVTYTYTVTNTGNAPVTGVTISDVHADATHGGPTTIVAPTITSEALQVGAPFPGSADAAINGVYDTLAPGATVTFTYTHTITQAEINGG